MYGAGNLASSRPSGRMDPLESGSAGCPKRLAELFNELLIRHTSLSFSLCCLGRTTSEPSPSIAPLLLRFNVLPQDLPRLQLLRGSAFRLVQGQFEVVLGVGQETQSLDDEAGC